MNGIQDGGGTGKPLQPATRLVTAGRDPVAQHGFVNHADLSRLDRALSEHRGIPQAQGALHLRHQGYSDDQVARGGLDRALRRCRNGAGALRACGDFARAARLPEVRRPPAGARFVYRPTRNFCDTVLKRFGVETTYYDPLLGADIASLFKPNTRAVFTEAPGSLSFEMQDIPAIAAVAHARDLIVLMDNTWATPLFFPPHARASISRSRPARNICSGPSDLLLGMVSANERCWTRAARDVRHDGDLRRAGGRVPRAARPAQHAGAAAASSAIGAGGGQMARCAARGRARAASGTRERSRSRDLETRFHRRVRPVQHRAQADAGRGGACLHQCADAVRDRRLMGRLRKPRDPVRLRGVPAPRPNGIRAGRASASISDWKMSAT